MTVLKRCCYSYSLKMGTLIIAIFFLVCSLVLIGTSAYCLSGLPHVHDDLSKLKRLSDTDIEKLRGNVSGPVDNILQQKGNDGRFSTTVDKALRKTRVAKTALLAGIVFATVQFICSFILIYGAIRENDSVLLLWVIVEAVLTKMLTVTGIVACITLFKVAASFAAICIAVFSILIYLLLSIYFLLVVYCLYRSLREKQDLDTLVEDREDHVYRENIVEQIHI